MQRPDDPGTDLHVGWDLTQQGEGAAPAIEDTAVAWGHVQDSFQLAGAGNVLGSMIRKGSSRGTRGLLKQADTPAPLRVESDKVKQLLDSIPATLDAKPLDQKYIDTGTLNLERSHQGAAPFDQLKEISKGDPAVMLDAVENAGDLTKVFNVIGETLDLTDPVRTHKSIRDRTPEQMRADLMPLLEGRQLGLANDKQLYALSSLHAAAGDKLLETARAIKSGAGTDAMRAVFAQQVETAAALEALLVGNTREVARALSARRIYANSLKGSDMASLTQAFEQNAMSPADIDRAATNFLKSYFEKGKRAATHDLVTRNDGWSIASEFWKSNLLSGPSTQIANASTSAATHLYETVLISPTAAAISTARRALGLGSDSGVHFSELVPATHGSFVGLRDGLSSGLEIMLDPKYQGLLGGEGKAGRGSAVIDKGEELGGTAGRYIGTAAVMPLRVMKATDEIVGTVALRSKLAQLQMREAMDLGLEGKQLSDFLDYSLDNPSANHWAEAKDYAKTVTFQNSNIPGLTGIISHNAANFVEALPALKFIAPFVRTMGNLTAYAIDNSVLSPLAVNTAEGATGLARSQFLADISAGGAKADYAFARFVSSSAMAAVVYTLYQQGAITGAGPADPKALEAAKAAGFRPNAIVLGGTTYTYDRLDPFASQVALIADALDRTRFAKTEQDPAGQVFDAVASFAHHLSKSSFAGSTKQLLEILNGGAGEAGARLGAGILSGFIPYSGALSAAARATDDKQRSASFEKDLGFTGKSTLEDIGQIISQTGAIKLPWKRDELRPARYWDGQIIVPEAHELARFLLPVQIAPVSKDPASLALLRNGVSPEVPSSIVSIRGVQFNLLDFDLGKGLVYDAYIESIGKARKEAVAEVLADSSFEGANKGVNSEQAIILSRALSKGHSAGEAQFFDEVLPAMARDKELALNDLARALGLSFESVMEQARSGELQSSKAMRFSAKGAPGKKPVSVPMFTFD